MAGAPTWTTGYLHHVELASTPGTTSPSACGPGAGLASLGGVVADPAGYYDAAAYDRHIAHGIEDAE
jgi:hypothetical protein